MLDIGCGPAALVPHVAQVGAHYTGIDLSPQMIAHARRRYGAQGRFLVADARDLPSCPKLQPASFDAAVFLLSVQNIDPLEDALRSAAWALRPGGRLVLLIMHPCFRIPRQSGWSYDAGRKLRSRRVDRYLSPLPIPLRPPSSGRGAPAYSFHRPLAAYINGLAACGLLLDALDEIPDLPGGGTHDEPRAAAEFPLFLAMRAVRSAGQVGRSAPPPLRSNE